MKSAVDNYSAGGGGYSKGGGGAGAFGGGSGGSRGSAGGRGESKEEKDEEKTIIESINDLTKEKYESLSDDDKEAIKKVLKQAEKTGFEDQAEFVENLMYGEISWDTAETLLKIVDVDSTAIDVIIETGKTVTKPEGYMKDLAWGQDYFMDSGTRALANGDISQGLADLSMSAVCSLTEIGYGAFEVSSELAADAIDGITSPVSSTLDKVGEALGGEAGWFICDIADGIESRTSIVSDFVRDLLK